MVPECRLGDPSWGPQWRGAVLGGLCPPPQDPKAGPGPGGSPEPAQTGAAPPLAAHGLQLAGGYQRGLQGAQAGRARVPPLGAAFWVLPPRIN